MQREPSMADSQNRSCSSEREFAFRGQGFAVAEVCDALLESDHDQPPSSPKVLEPIGRQFGVANRVLNVAVAQVGLQCPRIVALAGQREATGIRNFTDLPFRLAGA